MARTRQTARRSTGGKAPRTSVASISSKRSRGRGGGRGRGRGGRGRGRGGRGGGGRGGSVYHFNVGGSFGQNECADDEELEEDPLVLDFDVEHESTFYTHYFDRGDGNDAPVTKEFASSFSVATCAVPQEVYPDEKEDDYHYFAWHLSSQFDGEGIKTLGRPPLQVIFLLDVSGSMQCPFLPTSTSKKLIKANFGVKLAVAKKAVISLLDQLKVDDWFGFAVFSNDCTIVHELQRWGETDRMELEKKVTKLRANGGTQIARGMEVATEMLNNAPELGNGMRRVICLTDMEVSDADGQEFVRMIGDNSDAGVYATVTGIGCDLASGVIKQVSSIPGCNYSNVLTPDDFHRMITKEFDHFVTPVAFNLELKVTSDEHELQNGYGSFEVRDLPTDGAGKRFVSCKTLFPSLTNEHGEVRSGLLLFRVSGPVGEAHPLQIEVNHDNQMGIRQTERKQIVIPEAVGTYSSRAVRKAVNLTHYVDFVQKYLKLRHTDNATEAQITAFMNQRKSLVKLFDHFVLEITAICDPSMVNEVLKTMYEIAKHDDIPLNTGLEPADVVMETKGKGKKRKREDEGDGKEKDEPPKKKLKLDAIPEDQRPPAQFICPITMEIMDDPVFCADGHTYERQAISDWLSENATSPSTNVKLVNKNLIPNHALRGLIVDWMAKNGVKDPMMID